MTLPVLAQADGWVVIAKTGKFGFTTSFQAKYRRPVRIGLPTEWRGWMTRQSRRVVRVHTTTTQAGQECASADFTFAILARQAAEDLMGVRLPEGWDRFCV